MRKDPMTKAETAVSVATVAFTEAADQLELAAAELVSIAIDADASANAQLQRAAAARTQADAARRKAFKIRDLLA